jgi:hypothetical protein
MNYIGALLLSNGLDGYDSYVVFEYIMESLQWKLIYKPPLNFIHQILNCLHGQLSVNCKKLIPILYYDWKGGTYENLRINGGMCVHIMTLFSYRYSCFDLATYIMGVFLLGSVLIRGR